MEPKQLSEKVLRLQNDVSWMAQVKETKGWVENYQKEIERQKKAFVPFETVDDVLESAEYARNVLNTKGVSYTTTQVAKELGMHSGRVLNEELRQAGIIYKQNKDWLLKSKYEGYDLTTSRTIRQGNKNYSRTLMWTERGRMWLHNLKKRGLILTEPKPTQKEEPRIVSLKNTDTPDAQKLREEIQCLLYLVSSIDENETLNSKEILLVDIMDISTTIQNHITSIVKDSYSLIKCGFRTNYIK